MEAKTAIRGKWKIMIPMEAKAAMKRTARRQYLEENIVEENLATARTDPYVPYIVRPHCSQQQEADPYDCTDYGSLDYGRVVWTTRPYACGTRVLKLGHFPCGPHMRPYSI